MSSSRRPWKQEFFTEKEAQKLSSPAYSMKSGRRELWIMEKKNSSEVCVSPASFRSLSDYEGLNLPTWIISEIFSQLVYNTKCINT